MRDDNIEYMPVGKVKSRKKWAATHRKTVRFLYGVVRLVLEVIDSVFDAMMLIIAGIIFGAGFYMGCILMSLCRV